MLSVAFADKFPFIISTYMCASAQDVKKCTYMDALSECLVYESLLTFWIEWNLMLVGAQLYN